MNSMELEEKIVAVSRAVIRSLPPHKCSDQIPEGSNSNENEKDSSKKVAATYDDYQNTSSSSNSISRRAAAGIRSPTSFLSLTTPSGANNNRGVDSPSGSPTRTDPRKVYVQAANDVVADLEAGGFDEND